MKQNFIFLLLISVLFIGCSEVEDTDTGEVTIDDGTPDILQTYVKPTTFDTQGARSFSLVPKTDVSFSTSGSGLLLVAVDGCLVSDPLDITGDVIVDAEICVLAQEAYADDYGYVAFKPIEVVVDPLVSTSIMLAEVVAPPTYYTVKDPLGKLHYLDRVPVKNGHKNSPTIHVNNGKAVFLSGGKVWEHDLSTDIETQKFTEDVDRFYTVDKTNGRNYITVPAFGFVTHAILHKANGADATIDLSNSEYNVPIGINDGILFGDRYIGIDGSGDQVLVKAGSLDSEINGWWRSNQNTLDAWIISGIGGQPQPVSSWSTVGVKSGNYFISDKVYRLGDVSTDFEVFDVWNYGHNSLNDWSVVKMCGSGYFLYLYATDLASKRLTFIDESTITFRDILDTHQVTELECSKEDNILLVCGDKLSADGTPSGEMETIRFTEAHTAGFTKMITSGCEAITQAP